MATIVGYDERMNKRITCYNCGAIVEYKPNEPKPTGHTDEGTKIVGLTCPGCHQFIRTNP